MVLLKVNQTDQHGSHREAIRTSRTLLEPPIKILILRIFGPKLFLLSIIVYLNFGIPRKISYETFFWRFLAQIVNKVCERSVPVSLSASLFDSRLKTETTTYILLMETKGVKLVDSYFVSFITKASRNGSTILE